MASAIVGTLLDRAGFDGMLATQSAGSINMITNVYLLTPILCFGFVAVLMLFYKLDQQLPSIIKELDARRRTA